MKVAVEPAAPAPIVDAVTAAGGTISGASDADAVVWTNPWDTNGLAVLLEKSPARWVQLPFAGIESFFEAGVVDASRTWTCAKGIYGHATAEHALTLMLAAARRIQHHARERRWIRGESGERRLAGTTAVIAGTGGIGASLARMLEALEVRVIAVNRSGPRLADVAGEADWIVLAVPLTPSTTHLVDATLIARMKPDAWIVNVARGPVVDTDAMVDALRAGRIGGAALDVTDPEPLPDDHPLWSFDNVIVTSHTANTASMAIPALAAMVRRNVAAFAAGEPLEGLVDPALGY